MVFVAALLIFTSVVTTGVLSQAPPFSCRNRAEGQYPNPSDCAGYFECASNLKSPTVRSCAPGTLFDAESSCCLASRRVSCNGRPQANSNSIVDYSSYRDDNNKNIDITIYPDAYLNSDASTGGPGPVPKFSCRNRDEGLYVNPSDCAGYYECATNFNADDMPNFRSCAPGLLFHEIARSCLESKAVACNGRPLPTRTNNNNGYNNNNNNGNNNDNNIDFNNNNNNNGFMSKNNNNKNNGFNNRNNNGNNFNNGRNNFNNNNNDDDVNGYNSYSTGNSNNNIDNNQRVAVVPFSNQATNVTAGAVGQIIDFSCRNRFDGLYVNPLDCAGYFQCNRDFDPPYVRSCAPGTLFDDINRQCLAERSVQCNGRPIVFRNNNDNMNSNNRNNNNNNDYDNNGNNNFDNNNFSGNNNFDNNFSNNGNNDYDSNFNRGNNNNNNNNNDDLNNRNFNGNNFNNGNNNNNNRFNGDNRANNNNNNNQRGPVSPSMFQSSDADNLVVLRLYSADFGVSPRLRRDQCAEIARQMTTYLRHVIRGMDGTCTANTPCQNALPTFQVDCLAESGRVVV